MPVIRSDSNPPVAEMRPRLVPRVEAARVIVFAEAAMFAVVGVSYVGQQPFDVRPLLLSLGAAALLGWGARRMGRDEIAEPAPVPPEPLPRVAWDWTDVLIFFPGAFIVGQLLIQFAVLITHAFTTGIDPAVGTAVDSFVAQGAYYAGALFNLWVLVRLRRNGTLADLGWRRFRWWWLLIAVVGAFATLEAAGFLQEVMQRAFPSLQNTQCVAVKHEYGHFLALALIVVCIVAPIAEETIFRGFVYGWLHRVAGVPLGIIASAVIFSAVHGVPLLFLPLFAVGCVLALFYQGSRSIWPGAFVHGLFNLPGIIVILYSPSC